MFPEAYDVGPAGWYHLIVFGVLLPAVVVRNYRRLVGKKLPLPNRMRHFQTTTGMLVLLTVLSVLVAETEWIELFTFDASRLPAGLGAGGLMFVGTVAFMRPRWRGAVERRARIVSLFMPGTKVERTWWIGVSVLAGVGEEITWRGVQTALLTALTGSYVLGSLLSAVSFGLAHFIQGWKSAAIITIFALGFQTVVWISGSLFIAMAVHMAYDITAGITYGRLGRELGYAPIESQ